MDKAIGFVMMQNDAKTSIFTELKDRFITNFDTVFKVCVTLSLEISSLNYITLYYFRENDTFYVAGPRSLITRWIS